MRAGKDILLMFVIVLVLLGLLFAMGRTGAINVPLEARARQAVEARGYTILESRGYEFWACGKDAHGFNFLTQTPSGMQVNLTACTDKGVFGINKSFWIVTR